MRNYVIRRLGLFIPVVFGVLTFVFFIIHLIPGDPVDLMLGESAFQSDREALRNELGLDRPLHVQYIDFLAGVVRGNLGKSLHSESPVSTLILERFPATLELTLGAMVIALLIAIPAGIISALRQYSILDNLSMFSALLGISIPNFWLGPMLILIFSIYFDLLPVSGMGGISHLILPSITLGTAMAALLTRMTRSALLEVMKENYITTARSKGVGEAKIISFHALFNALIPLITVAGLQFGALLSGSIITETIFSWPGIGRLVIQAISWRDYPLVQGCVLVIALSYVTVNLMVDLLYAYIDPRIRLQ